MERPHHRLTTTIASIRNTVTGYLEPEDQVYKRLLSFVNGLEEIRDLLVEEDKKHGLCKDVPIVLSDPEEEDNSYWDPDYLQ